MLNLKLMGEVQYYSAFAMQITIAGTMFSRGLFKQARFFFAYILWQTVSVAVLYVLIHRYPNGPQFFYGYWINNAVTISLGLAIIFEMFNRMFDQYSSVRKFAKTSLIVTALVLCAIGAIFSTFNDVAFSVPMLTVFMVAERSLRIVQLGLILMLFALSKYLHLRWRNYLFGIALGFGFYALMALVGLTVRMYYGRSIAAIENTLQGTAYVAAVLIWTSYVLQPDAVKIPVLTLPSHDLEKWDRALGQILVRQ